MARHLDELQYQTLSDARSAAETTPLAVIFAIPGPENQAHFGKPGGEVCHLRCWARCAIASVRKLTRIAGQLTRFDLSTIHHRLSSVVEAAQVEDYAAARSELLFMCAISWLFVVKSEVLDVTRE
jgi:hypothetical protein